ncbi:hypothetical protein [Streptomyces sp. st140]|uniref:hypothetical protein n=1 Tax=Streptomyces sp. st140 TaxID=1828052 RepID=UPI00117C34DE|nr:hypothetical protein [Streptomyces sp. st140]
MNEGFIAVVAALIGAASAWAVSRHQASAAHDQWLRQVRREVYAGFLATARDEMERTFGEVSARSAFTRLTAREWASAGEEMFEAACKIDRAAEAMKLEAPENLASAVDDFRAEVWLMATSSDVEEFRVSYGEVSHELTRIAALCKTSLQTT